MFDRASYWESLCRRWRGHVPPPSIESARRRAERARADLAYLESVGDCEAAAEQRITMLTQLARALLIEHEIYPASRPELQEQLRRVDEVELAEELGIALRQREIDMVGDPTAGRAS